MTWWWLSFADEDGFRGVVIVEASNFLSAVLECNRRKINPHGEIRGLPMPPLPVDDKWKNRILTREECKILDREMCELADSLKKGGTA